MKSSYRDSHSDPEYGQRYARTYSVGYYYEQWVKIEEPLLRTVLGSLRHNGAGSCLDFACGTGRILSVVEKVFPVAHGVDISDSMLAEARKVCRQALIEKRDLTRSPMAKRFDVVTAFRFFLNAEPCLRNDALQAIYAHLTDNGVLVANCHVSKWSPLGLFYRLRQIVFPKKKANTLSLSEFKKILEENCFQVRAVHWYGYLPRTGWYLGWIPRIFMLPAEKLVKKTHIVPEWMAQAFVLVCEKQPKP